MVLKSSFTISLDFELYWGVRDKRSLESYRDNLLGVWEVIPKMLMLFKKYDIHVTWATVGFLFLEDEKEFKDMIPKRLPQYNKIELSPYVYFESIDQKCFEESAFQKMHFSYALIKEIQTYAFQEIATHTYSHYYTREPKILPEVFKNDLEQAVSIAEKKNIAINSLVFPRNQIDHQSIDTLKDIKIKVYRGNPTHWAYKEGEVEKTFWQRVYRFIDIYINLSGGHSSIPKYQKNGLCEVKSSLFMRAYSQKFKLLEYFKLRRVKKAMTQAAQKGENFHLWWHPHNFGVHQKENLENLEEILKHFEILHKKFEMESLNMKELGDVYAAKI